MSSDRGRHESSMMWMRKDSLQWNLLDFTMINNLSFKRLIQCQEVKEMKYIVIKRLRVIIKIHVPPAILKYAEEY